MKKHLPKLVVLVNAGLFLVVIWFLSSSISQHNFGFLNPQGLVASRERKLVITAVFLMLFVIVPLLVSAYFFAWKYREGRAEKYEPEGDHGLKGGFLWAIVPAIVVGGLIYLGWQGAHQLDPYKKLDSSTKPIKIQVVALNWKWLFIYPDQGIATVNFIQFPVSTPVDFQLTADGPMNSFWIPQLSGQIYAMNGMSTELHMMANKVGEYRGSAAEINGDGYAGMVFKAKASTESDFTSWIDSVKKQSNPLNMSQYDKLVEPSQDNPVSFYSSVDQDLYNKIVMKYLTPDSSQSAGPVMQMRGMRMP